MKDLIERIKNLFPYRDYKMDLPEENMEFGNYFEGVDDGLCAVIKVINEWEEEQANKTFLDRLKEERDDVAKKFDKLSIFMNDEDKFSEISKNQQNYLEQQHFFMKGYLLVLDERIEDFAKNGE